MHTRHGAIRKLEANESIYSNYNKFLEFFK